MKNKLKLVLVLIALIHTKLNAQHNIKGTVLDKATNEVLIGATIYQPDLKTGTVTNENGIFIIPNLKTGHYIIKISSLGYKPMVKNIFIDGDTNIIIKLLPSATELNEIIITGTTRISEIKQNPIIIKTMSSEKLEQSTSTNLIDALKSIPGINNISSGPSISKPIIRGLGYNRVISLNNGIKQEGQQWGNEHGIEIDEYRVDRVEIIKGPGSLLYGSDGIAGVINFLPPKIPLDGEVRTQILSNYQSNNNLIGYSFFNSGNKGKIQWSARLSNKYAANYQNKYDGKVLNSGYNELNGNFSLGINRRWGHSTLSGSSFNTKLGIVEGSRDSLGNFTYENKSGEQISASAKDLNGYNLINPYQLVNHQSLISKSYFILKKGSLNTEFSFQNNKRKEFEDAETQDEAGLSLSLNTTIYNIRWNLENFKGWETSIGIGGMIQNNANKGNEFLIPDYNLFDNGSFIFSQKKFKKIVLAAGIRLDNRLINANELFLDSLENVASTQSNYYELKFSALNKSYWGTAGSLGLTYQLKEKSTIKFNLSQGFRAPNISELTSNGKHEGSFRYEIGNSTLKPEISRQIDFAYYYISEHITLEISPFINFVNNYSYLEKLKNSSGNDSIIDLSDPTPTFKYTYGNAYLLGAEIYLDWHPHPFDWLHIENSFSFVNANLKYQTDSTKYLPFIPAPHYRGGLEIESKKISNKISKLFLSIYFDRYFDQNRIYSAYNTETITRGYNLLSAGIGMNIKRKKKEEFIKLFFNVDNITNTAYQSHLSKLKYAEINPTNNQIGVYNMGRNFSFKMILEF